MKRTQLIFLCLVFRNDVIFFQKIAKKESCKSQNVELEKWRRERDLNPRYTFGGVHTISSRAPSAARTSLLEKFSYQYKEQLQLLFLFWRREGDSNPRGSFVAPNSISSRSRYDHFGTSPRFYHVAEAGADVTLFSLKNLLIISPHSSCNIPSVIFT